MTDTVTRTAAARHGRCPRSNRSPPVPPAATPAGHYGERRSVTTKPTTRSAASRGSPPPAARGEAKLQEIVSVRFTDEELRRIQAFAVIFETTPNAVIRDACSFFLSQKVGTPEYDKALEAYHRRTSEVVDVLNQINGTDKAL
jgi:hypothetical protein